MKRHIHHNTTSRVSPFCWLLLSLPIVGLACSKTPKRSVPSEQATAAQLARYKAFAIELRERGIVDVDGARSLSEAIDQGKINNGLLDIVPYCTHGRVISLADYDRHKSDAHSYLLAIHKDIASVMPELEFAGFRGSSGDGRGEATFTWQVEFDHDGHRYHQRMHDNNIEEMTTVFNRVLEDMKSPYRIQKVYRETPAPEKGLVPDGGFPAFGVIALTEAQVHGLSYGGPGSKHITKGGYSSYITPAHIQRAINAYKAIGMLDHLTDTQVQAITDKALKSSYSNFNEILALFPGVVHQVDFETLKQLRQPYRQIVEDLAAIAANRFRPRRIQVTSALDADGQETFSLSFMSKAKTYKILLEEFQPDVDEENTAKTISLANKALAASRAGGQFYVLFSTRQQRLNGVDVSVVHLSDKQRVFLGKANLLSFSLGDTRRGDAIRNDDGLFPSCNGSRYPNEDFPDWQDCVCEPDTSCYGSPCPRLDLLGWQDCENYTLNVQRSWLPFYEDAPAQDAAKPSGREQR